MPNNRLKFNWDSVDWTNQDMTISRELGCSRERVRQVRKKLGKPKSPLFRKHNGGKPSKNKLRVIALGEQGLGPNEIVKQTGLSLGYVSQVKGPTVGAHKARFWSSLDWENLRNRSISEIYGYHEVMVARMRRKYSPETIGKFRGRRT